MGRLGDRPSKDFPQTAAFAALIRVNANARAVDKVWPIVRSAESSKNRSKLERRCTVRRMSRPTSRRGFIRAATLATASLTVFEAAAAQPTEEQLKQAEFLFVQSAKGMTFDKATNKLTLIGVSPVTVFFSDRPDRIAGNMKTSAFIPFWSQGSDSFKTNPPNADISLLEDNGMKQIVAELQDPVLAGEDLSYTIKILQGEMPARGSDVAVFIDFAGGTMLLQMRAAQWASYDRRNYRRAYWKPN
jgi:hypothetical protein